eukprot:TRINITY_DN6966_c0_g1_i3.p1 TRINITY_DN6966_c0_g1~~TRINITY_DN6966_c0_g1_i3.p1  ORF type:complete len:1342 (-),score=166.48 TRINITY_DN6966_c0_g1_i3:187-4212(-)
MSSGDKVVCTGKTSGGAAATVFGSDTGSATVPTVSTPSMTITVAVISGSSSVYTFAVAGAVPNNADAVFTIPSGALGSLPSAGANYKIEVLTTNSNDYVVDNAQSSGGTFTIVAASTVTWTGSSNDGQQPYSLRMQVSNPALLALNDIIEITASQAIFTTSVSATAESASSGAVALSFINGASTYETNAGGTVFTITILSSTVAANQPLDLVLAGSAVLATVPSVTGAVTLTIKMGTSGSLQTVLYQKAGWLTITNTVTSNVAVSPQGLVTGVVPGSIQVIFRPATSLSNGEKIVCTAKASGGGAAVVFGTDGTGTVPTFATPSLTIATATISGSGSVFTFTVTGAVPNNADADFTIAAGALAVLPAAAANYEIEVSTTDSSDYVIDDPQTSGGTFTVIAAPTITWTGSANDGNAPVSLRIQVSNPYLLAINDIIEITASQAIFTTSVSATAESASSGAVAAAQINDASTYETNAGGTVFTITVLTATTSALAAVDITLTGAPVLAALPSVTGAVTMTIKMGTSGSLQAPVYQNSGWLTITNTVVANVVGQLGGYVTGVTPLYITVTFRPATAMVSGDKIVCTAKDSGGSVVALFGSDTGTATVPTFTTPSLTITSATISGSSTVYTVVLPGAVPNSANAEFSIPAAALTTLPAAATNYEIEIATKDTNDYIVDDYSTSGGTFTIIPTPTANPVATGKLRADYGSQIQSLAVSFQTPQPIASTEKIKFTFDQTCIVNSVDLTAQSGYVAPSGITVNNFLSTSTNILEMTVGSNIAAGVTISFTIAGGSNVFTSTSAPTATALATIGSGATGAETIIAKSITAWMVGTAALTSTGGLVTGTTPSGPMTLQFTPIANIVNGDAFYVYSDDSIFEEHKAAENVNGVGTGYTGIVFTFSVMSGTRAKFLVASGATGAGVAPAGNALTLTVPANSFSLLPLPYANTMDFTIDVDSSDDGTAEHTVAYFNGFPEIIVAPVVVPSVTGTQIDTLAVSFETPVLVANTEIIKITFDQACLVNSVDLTSQTGYVAPSGVTVTSFQTVSTSAMELVVGADVLKGATVSFTLGGGSSVFTSTSASTATAFTQIGSGATGAETVIATSVSAWASGGFAMSDPVTIWQGKKTKFWLPPDQPTVLLETPDLRLSATPLPGPTQDLQWFESFIIETPHGQRVAKINVKPHALDANRSHYRHHRFNQLDIWLGNADLPLEMLRSQLYEIDGTGIKLAVSSSRHDPPRFHSIPVMEHVYVESQYIVFAVVVSHAGTEFPGDVKMQARYAHLDWFTVDMLGIEHYAGALPEIWGVQPMSAEVEAMLTAPSKRQLAEVHAHVCLPADSGNCTAAPQPCSA